MKRWFMPAALILTVTVTAGAQSSFREGGTLDGARRPNPSYDGRFAFVRLRYRTIFRDNADHCSGGASEASDWSHNYPTGELNLLHIMTQISTLGVKRDSTVILTADDTTLMKYPVAYVAEAACWQLSDAEVKALRDYMLKGGFLIVDDLTFSGPHVGSPEIYQTADKTIAQHLQRIFPEGKLVPIKISDPVFSTFFSMDPKNLVPLREGVPAMEFSGIYEDNDPSKRLLVLVTHNISIAFYWRFAEQGFLPVEVGNQAYKLGVNFVLYGVTH